ncbi:MAG: YggW family oxidoreductase [Oceanospirillaceae bacterium]|jgi:oxygen-independent coproporphyrinogen-3 oxidase|uniref:radical SAM family heme chaperone HemW n=1 Tax=unclassified Thalassolituus TaxID=2624967 RepID=UPI000B671953|nr:MULTISPECIES: radical SAM family heme chaperone HemW [unclassified Thalassolituus]MAE34129.1 YggW family oxidoreductase [Oceanospirillaceae bacterium]OUX64583.1 MAG: YggW family oxidoreductase [Oceanospirillaceae bacterium TMED276]MBN58077.1 YggW family oxidoreductase [Oceanospirillaceae bacterium]MDQ4423579.1 radical SAM family heme chaperone HemW [Thalassolituus sp.]MDQ4425581.1 radical SAM family heme chaperone HemW [Thalassolituus sp.]|tara:strand:- start:411 stop:1556 length:1146 start_codon:yes stop_codon:yes gene_type:complete
MTLPPLSLYIHIPWCVRKCPYCDFNSHEAGSHIPEAEYINALLKDLEQDLHWVQGRAIKSIFFGGGTPSLLSAHAYETLFTGLSEKLSFSSDIEITLEANPGTFEADKFKAYRQLGINRLSMGIQSFQPEHLKKLGRIHDRAQALAAIETAINAGFSNFNLDLMHGLPDQTPEQALDDLNTALSFQPPHLSWYQLTIEPNTEFYKRPPVLPEDDTLWDIQEQGQERLAHAGLRQYEISAYSLPQQQAKHNINYWRFGDYLGIGAGAHGKITSTGPQGLTILRTRKTRLPKDYLNSEKRFLAGQDRILPEDTALECMMNALRLQEGIPVSDFEARTGMTLDSIRAPLNKALSLGLIECSTDIRASERGQQYLNELLALFLTD